MITYDTSSKNPVSATWQQLSGKPRTIQDYWPAGAIFLLLAAVSGLAFLTREENSFVHFLSMQLYIVPIVATGWFYGWTVTPLVSLAVTFLFVPREVALVYSTGLSQASTELFAELVSYNLYAVLTILALRFRRRQRRLHDAVESLGKLGETGRDLPKLLPLAVDQGKWLSEADGGAIFLSEDPGFASPSLAGVSFMPEDAKNGGDSVPGGVLLDWLARRNVATVLSDLSADPRFVPPPELARGRVTLVGVPLNQNRKRLGTLAVWKYGDRRFNQTDIDLLNILANQIQMAIETAAFHLNADETLSKRTHELSMLLEASAAFSSIRDLDHLVKTLCQKMTEVVESTFCRLFLLDADGTNLIFRASYTVRDIGWQPEVGHAFPVDSLPWHRQAVVEKEPIVLLRDDPEAQVIAPEYTILFGQGGRSALLVPLVVGDRCLGVATVAEMRSWERTPFDGEKIDLCRTFTRQAALVIENIRAFESEAELVRMKSDLVALVSHELRAPLTNISTSVQLLAQLDLDQPTSKDLIQTLNQETVRLVRLVDQVLGAERAGNQPLRLTLEPLALVPLIEQTVSVCRSQYKDYEFRVMLEGSPYFALGDRVSVEIILQNLIQNAVNYSPVGSTITIDAKERGDDILVRVCDQGVGIPSDQLESIFQRGHRLPDSAAANVSGFGFGLYIVRMLLEAQSGQICVESKPGQGSTFVFALKRLETQSGQEDSDH